MSAIHSGPPVITAADVSDHWLPPPSWLTSDYAKAGALTVIAVLIGCAGAAIAHLIRARF